MFKKINYKIKFECPVCGDVQKRPRQVQSEHLFPKNADSPHTQFVVWGQCGHIWKMSAEEFGHDTLQEIIKVGLWQRILTSIKPKTNSKI